MSINNPPKAAIALVFIVGVIVLMAIRRLDQTAGVGLLTFAAGYIFGNGVAAKKGDAVEPILGGTPRVPPSDTP